MARIFAASFACTSGFEPASSWRGGTDAATATATTTTRHQLALQRMGDDWTNILFVS